MGNYWLEVDEENQELQKHVMNCGDNIWYVSAEYSGRFVNYLLDCGYAFTLKPVLMMYDTGVFVEITEDASA